MKKIAIIGAKGMVGQNLVDLYSGDSNVFSITRENIESYKDFKFDSIFIAAADGRKYIANKEPYLDLISIMKLINTVRYYDADKIILISTVDVYNTEMNSGNENTNLTIRSPSYGSNRLQLEFALRGLFKEKLLVIRLQGLIAGNLKKNILFDIKNNRALGNFSNDTTFQFYPLNRLRMDIDAVLTMEIRLCNLSAEPISIKELFSIINRKLKFSKREPIISANYNVKSLHKCCDNDNGYWINKSTVISEIKNYLDIS